MSEHESIQNVQLTEFLYRKAGSSRIPLSGTFELTPVCNFACRMCYVRKTAGEVARCARSTRSLGQWLRIAQQAREAGMLFLLLTGGEPLIWPHFWELYEKLIRMGFVICINTNGSLIDEEAIEKFRKLPPKRLNITLYGANEETYQRLCCAKGMYEKVDRAIRGLRKAGIGVKLNCSLTPYNVQDLEAMIAYAREQKLVIDVTSYMFPPIRREEFTAGVNDSRFTPEDAARYRLLSDKLQCTPQQYRSLLESIRRGAVDPPGLDEGCVDPVDGKIRCRAGSASFWITWDGWLTPCGLLPEPKVDLEKTSFPEAWEQLTGLSAGVRLSGVCRTCPNVHLCHPCAAMAVAETGSPSGIPQYLCRQVRELRRLAEEELNSLPGGQKT